MRDESWKVTSWLDDFLTANWPTFAGHAWPDPGDPERRHAWSEWLNGLKENKAFRVEVEEAVERITSRDDTAIVENPSAWLANIIAEIKSIRSQATSNPAALNERAAAQDASRDCRHCGGEGLVIVDGARSTVAAHCVCPMGRWMRGRTPQDLIRRIPDYADYLKDRSEQAASALREFYDLGWEFRWYPEDRQFRTHRARLDAPEKVSRDLSNRCRELRREIYSLLNHPVMDEDEVMDMDDFRDEDGKFNWRKMMAAIAERGKQSA